MMKACLLGAGGGFGIGAVEDLCESLNVSQIIACDIRIEEMKAYREEVGIDPKLSFLKEGGEKSEGITNKGTSTCCFRTICE